MWNEHAAYYHTLECAYDNIVFILMLSLELWIVHGHKVQLYLSHDLQQFSRRNSLAFFFIVKNVWNSRNHLPIRDCHMWYVSVHIWESMGFY